MKSISVLLILFFTLPAFIFAQSDTSHLFNSFDGTKIYYEVKGKGKPVVLIHGFIVTGESWKRTELYNDLQDSGFQIITLDMRGNGRSDKPHSPELYANDAEARDIMGLVNMLKIKKYSVVGYSRGSIIVSRLLVMDKRVNAGVMGGMGSDFTNPEWPRRKMFYRALMGDSVQELQGMVRNVKASGLDQLALAYLQKEQPSTSKQALSKLNQRVLVICGREDTDNGSAEALAKLIPKATYRTVPGDHGGAVKTKEFSEEVISFLKH